MENYSESIVYSLIHSWIVLDLRITEKSLKEAEARLNYGDNFGIIHGLINEAKNHIAYKRIEELIEQRNEINSRLRNFKINYGSFILPDREFIIIFKNIFFERTVAFLKMMINSRSGSIKLP